MSGQHTLRLWVILPYFMVIIFDILGDFSDLFFMGEMVICLFDGGTA